MGEVEYIIAKYKYDAQEAKELSIEKNELLTLLDDSGKWWKVRNDSDCEGFVPSNYVRRVNWKDAIGRRLGMLKESLRRRNGSESLPTSKCFGSPLAAKSSFRSFSGVNETATSSKLSSCLFIAHACFEYKPCRDDELFLRKDDCIEVMQKSSDGWWRGRCGSRVGWFPSNYVVENSSPINRSPKANRDDDDDDRDLGKMNAVDRSTETCNDNAADALLDYSNQRLNDRTRIDRLEAFRQHAIANGSAKILYSGREWYFGRLTRDQSQKLLDEYGHDGDYLIRDSESNPGDLSISLKAPSKNKHFWIQVDADGFRIGNRRFTSIDELIGHYMVKPISSNGRGENLYLVKPLS
ncbi:cytoplasmic protein NCK2 [Trichuris trichiura]|uniref:Cytoplasmic protein NCK2 n=1 Tax=Trichuris trichiura TaxID=36087 RepID=A0A077Z690_TRITR|nr:cytoplasmic protein NCK2 [Trichuris trichiura]